MKTDESVNNLVVAVCLLLLNGIVYFSGVIIANSMEQLWAVVSVHAAELFTFLVVKITKLFTNFLDLLSEYIIL